MPVYHSMIEHGRFTQVLVCNPGHVKNVPGRKTDYADAEWLVQLLECGLLNASFIPITQVKAARDVLRYHTKVVQQRTSEIQRLGAVLQDAGIKLDSVASSIATVSGRHMIEALIDGERRGADLAELALGNMRTKIPNLSMALEGRFDEHPALICRLHLEHLDLLDAMIAELDVQVEEMMVPFRAARELLRSIPGIGSMAAAQIIGEIGVAPQEFFATAAKLAAWSGLAPGNHESAGKRKSGRRRHGNQHLQPVLVEAAWSAVRHTGYLRSLYHRHVMKNGGYRSGVAKKKAIVTVAHAMMMIVWHVLATGTPYDELGEDYFTTRKDPEKETQRLITRLQALGHKVTLEPAAV
ncbi:IS110 family transposase [Nonomuraea sp. B19D2]|uniref:IS110 family transposase n=1 Tax=Nonomuraea sp. B19D2 TaxID=3159561 RepID=UPI0032DB9C08